MNLIAMNTTVTLSSLDFLNSYINPAREAAGESVLRNTELLRKIEDECDDLGVKQKICLTSSGGRPAEYYDLTMDQMVVVGMRESKAVRHAVRDKLKELGAKQAPAIPQTYAAALLEAGRLAAEVEAKAAQLALAAPKVEFHDKYMDESGLTSFRELVKLLQLNEASELPRTTMKATEDNVSAFFVMNGIMHRVNGKLVPYAKWGKSGYFGMKKTPGYGGRVYTDALFTPKGVKWITRKWDEWKVLCFIEPTK